MKILLDPLIYWFVDDIEKELNLQYWDKITSIIEKYFNINYISSKYFIKILQRLNREPFSPKKEQGELKQKIIKRLWQNLDYPNNIENLDNGFFSFPDDYKFSTNDELNQYFSTVLNHIITNNIQCLLCLSRDNHKSKIITINQLFVVRNISGEVDSKITELIENGNYLKDGIETPKLHNPLPFSELCDYFLELQNEMKKVDDEISVFWRVTREVALRNRYSYDQNVTSKNNNDKHKRKIYTYNKKHYISADFESGCFELCDHRGKHQKEISYTGKELSSRDKSGGHDILV
jgi:hypothetical protein